MYVVDDVRRSGLSVDLYGCCLKLLLDRDVNIGEMLVYRFINAFHYRYQQSLAYNSENRREVMRYFQHFREVLYVLMHR